jgi:catechol-2,3-dioxygenase
MHIGSKTANTCTCNVQVVTRKDLDRVDYEAATHSEPERAVGERCLAEEAIYFADDNGDM